ncbi:MAG: pyridoxamine 5'-phosphate oxidase family protein [Planctomycetes bacterium]|nr:pyridoxamine 5'-phosphate oxidase family protein [Planctomycetota bacterium]
MAALPQIVRDAWADRDGPVVLATVSADGIPNVIYATCVGTLGDDRIVVADNYFDKTRRNILAGSRGALLFMTKGGKAYQVKGTIEYHRDGEVFASMKSWNPPKHPGHAAAALRVEEAFSGAKKLS